jgi:hypothetical protein
VKEVPGRRTARNEPYLEQALIVRIPAALLLVRALLLIRRHASAAGIMQICGSTCLMVVVFTHIAEALHILPAMHWGEPHSAGHYLDLTSALLALTLLPVGFWMEWIAAGCRSHRRMWAPAGMLQRVIGTPAAGPLRCKASRCMGANRADPV